jgi:4-amino-4-deoxy-L-arabinose transferase-like glycosyltransferase
MVSGLRARDQQQKLIHIRDLEKLMVKRYWLDWIEGFLIFILIAMICVLKMQYVPFEPDESQWISTSSVYEAFVSADFSSAVWAPTYWTVTQPPLARYAIGLGRNAGGLGNVKLNIPWDWTKDSQTNAANGAMPSAIMLWWSRLPMCFFTGVAYFLAFLLLKRFAGRILAYLGLGLCFINAYFSTTLLRALGDATLLVCIMIALILANSLLNSEKKSRNSVYLFFFAFGVAAGLAESAKLNGVFLLGAGAVIAVVLANRSLRSRTLKIRQTLVSILLLLVGSQGMFVALNPFLWRDPMTMTLLMFYDRGFEISSQKVHFPSLRINGLAERIPLLAQRIFSNFASLQFRGSMWLNLLLCLLGIGVIVISAYGYLRRRHDNPASLALLLVSFFVAAPSLMTPLDLPRYYLLPVFFSTLYIAVGIWWLGINVYRLVSGRILAARSA